MDISESILTIGCEYRPPKGGVAQVLCNYERYVFMNFKCITNSEGINRFGKLLKAVGGWIRMCCRLLFDRNIRIVHIHTASYNSFKRSAWFACGAQLFRKKVIMHIHGGGFKEYYATNPQWITSVLNQCDAIITLSDSWKQYYQTITNCPHIYVVENIVTPPEQKKLTRRENLFHLLFLGFLDEQKGIFDLLDALHEYIGMFRGRLILHVGGNGKVKELEERISRYGLNELVKYEGFVSGIKKTDLLFMCDAYILPSYTEGLPVSILEAMAYGKPILSTLVGGIPEVVEDTVNGYLFTPGDKKAMAKAIGLLMDDEETRISMGEESQERIKPFLPNPVRIKLTRIYEEVGM